MADLSLDPDSLSKLRVVDLREHLSNRGLSTSGLKAELVERLRDVLEKEQSGDVSASTDNSEEEIRAEEDVLVAEEEERTIEEDEKQRVGEEERLRAEEEERIRVDKERERIEEEERLEEERLRSEEEKRLEEERLRAEEERQREEEQERLRAEEEKRKEEEQQERLRIEEMKRIEKEKRLAEEQERLRIEEMERIEEEKRIAEEQERLRIEEMKRIEEEKRIAEEQERLRIEEMKRIEEEKRIAEEQERLRIEEMKRIEEEKRIAEEQERLRFEEMKRIEKEKRIAEEQERLRIEEMKRIEGKRIAEEQERLRAEEKKRAEENERILAEERRKAEKIRVEEEKRRAEEQERIEAEERRKEAEILRAEEEKRKLEKQDRLREEEEKRKAEEQERLRVEERKRLEAELMRIEEEKRRAKEQERIQAEERRKEAERLRAEEEKRKSEEQERRRAEAERLRIAEEKRKAEAERLRLEEEKRIEKERLRAEEEERIREEKRIAAEKERRMAEEEEMKKEQERWLVEEQMRRAQEEHKKRLQAEEHKRLLEEQQRLMEEELERQKNEQQLYQLQQQALMEQETQKEFSTSDNTTNAPLPSNSTPFVSIPTTINIMPPPPTVLISNIPPPPMIPNSHASISPSVQVSAPPTRFPPPLPNISSPPTPLPAQPFVAQLSKETGSKTAISDSPPDNNASESMDTSENAADIRLPQALEKVLARAERAQLLGIDPDSVVQPAPATEERVATIAKSNVVTLVAVDEDEYGEEEEANKKESKSRRRKKKKKKNRQNRIQVKNEMNKRSENEKSKENVDVDIEYVQEVIDISDPMYSQFMKIFEKFKLTEGEKEKEETPADAGKEANKEEAFNPMAFRKKPMDLDDDDEDQDEDKKEEEKPKLSKRKLKKLSRMTVAELKQKVNRPELVEMHDVTAKDPVLLLHLKASRNTVPVPRHWCFKRKYLQGKRGIEKPAFELPDFIKRTGIMEMRQALQEKEDQKTMKAKMRERVRPKLGKIDIDYQKLHDAFFKWQTKPRMTIHGDLYYEGKEFETRLKEKKPGDLSEDLRTALGMPTGPNANKCPPPWLIAMQRYGPPPSYPNLKIPGLNAPIPESCSFGYHAGGWGKPPVDETGRPLYGDVFGTQIAENQPHIQEEEIDHTLWGELESESSEEEEEDEEEEEEEEEEKQEDETGLVTPAEGLITPSGFSSIPAGMETPDMIELRKRKIEAEKEGGETPALYTILPEKKTERVGAAMMGSTHIYDLAGAIPGSKLKMPGTASVPPQGIEVALDPSELEMDTAAMAARYEQTMREQQSQLEKEDLSDMVAEHAARQKNKRKKQQLDSAKPPKKYKEFKF